MASIGTDQPTVDPSSAAGPSSPPVRRKKRQEDLVDPAATDSYAQYQPPRPPRNPARTASGQDVLDGQTGAFLSNDDDEESVNHEDAIGSYRREPAYAGPTDFAFQSRSYDDEDAALQAALKASMEDLPPGWEAPELKPKEKPIQRKASVPVVPSPPVAQPAAEETASGSRFREEIEDDDDEPIEQLTAGKSGMQDQ